MIIRAQQLTKTYLDPIPLTVLRNISLEAHAGESVAIMGKSGEGKSTLLHILGTLESPTSGALEICGKPAKEHLRLEHIGFIFQAYYLLEESTALENVLMPRRISRKKLDASYGMRLLEEVGMGAKALHLAKHLSGGEKQRVAIARALCNDPPIILADEPTGNLDHSHSFEIQQLLLSAAHKKNKCLIIATHDREFAAHCNRQLFLKDGQLYTEPI